MQPHLGIVCKEHRKRARLIMVDIAESAGVGRARIGRFEQGTPVQNRDQIVEAYARECGVTVEAIYREALRRAD